MTLCYCGFCFLYYLNISQYSEYELSSIPLGEGGWGIDFYLSRENPFCFQILEKQISKLC